MEEGGGMKKASFFLVSLRIEGEDLTLEGHGIVFFPLAWCFSI